METTVDGPSQQGELHDCGIVYYPNQPYLLCVMTKSKSVDITPVERTIAQISSIAYQYAGGDFISKK